ncbi:GL19476 [Drosophila persimilis]|uniref:GL19476 n=1 Tax=Drosophila persimilis TaxID=7234 RepID=B4G9F9_DROPE|nr:GL19476 [Drosophila persimilis]
MTTALGNDRCMKYHANYWSELQRSTSKQQCHTIDCLPWGLVLLSFLLQLQSIRADSLAHDPSAATDFRRCRPCPPLEFRYQGFAPTAPAADIVSHYLPPKPTGPIVSTYLPPPVAAPISSISFHGQTPTLRPVYGPPGYGFSQPLAPTASTPIVVPSGPGPVSAGGPPLRIPFGKQALISPGESYVANGRQLKQYAVIEIIDNDIDESPAPFLSSSSFFDRFGAHLGASSGPSNGVQLDSRANSLLLEQQSLSIQPRSQGGQGDAIALGSGGLGFVRLANGNVYLGSGSLGYISGQQRVASVLDARTRSDSTPDALHFGHGPLGGAENFLRFK